MPKIDGDRLLGDLRALAEIGKFKTGVHRPTYSPQDVESRHWLAAKLTEAGLDVEIDGIGNVIGRSKAPGPKLLMGSHIESQNEAGWLDGAMGVIYGLEVARAFAADPATSGFGIDIAAWADEEGHYGSFLGSRSFVGELGEEEIDRCKSRNDGTPLRTALERAGFAGKPRAQIDPSRYRGYLEAHIEQGAELEDKGLQIGVVTGIVGNWQHRITFEGVQNHAGTTRMAIRKDAGAALIKFMTKVEDAFPLIVGPRTVWTAGKITLDPGAPNIIPGKAELMFQFRDTDPRLLRTLEAAIREIAMGLDGKPCKVTVEQLTHTVPKSMDAGFQDALDRAAAAHAPGKYQRMPSGAGHDAQILALKLPSAMLFVPSIGGISHHWAENTSDADLVLGCQVFADGAANILTANE